MQSPLLTLHDPANARRYYASGLWRDETLYGLLERHAAERPDDFALRDGRTRLSWSALRRLVNAIAGDLHASGLKRGQAGRGLAAEPGRDDRGVSGLLAPGLSRKLRAAITISAWTSFRNSQASLPCSLTTSKPIAFPAR